MLDSMGKDRHGGLLERTSRISGEDEAAFHASPTTASRLIPPVSVYDRRGHVASCNIRRSVS
jgi:hypothetical protein